MGLILLEALGAGVLLVLIVWWTMFSGRVKGELPPAQDADPLDPPHWETSKNKLNPQVFRLAYRGLMQ